MQGFCLSSRRGSERTSSPRAAQKKDVVVVIPSDRLIFWTGSRSLVPNLEAPALSNAKLS